MTNCCLVAVWMSASFFAHAACCPVTLLRAVGVGAADVLRALLVRRAPSYQYTTWFKTGKKYITYATVSIFL